VTKKNQKLKTKVKKLKENQRLTRGTLLTALIVFFYVKGT